MKKLKSNRGFTLIEIVVVIVIIAILAAILVPSLLTWIDNAKEKTILSEADTIRNTVAAEMIELYKDGKDINGTQTASVYDVTFWKGIEEKVGKKIQGSDSSKDYYLTFTISDQKITNLTYKSGKITAIYDDEKWTAEHN